MKFRVVNIVENVGKRVICVKLRRISVNHVFVWIGSRQSAVMPPQARRPGLIVHRPFYGAGASHASPAVAARQRRLGRHMHATVTAVWRHAMFFVTLT